MSASLCVGYVAIFFAKEDNMNTAAGSFSELSGCAANKTTVARKRESEDRQSAEPVHRIIDRDTGKHVGWLYKWNTGKLVPMWMGKPCENVVYASTCNA